MAIRHKRKNSTGYTWLDADLVDGQIGINTADGTLHVKKTDDSVVTFPNDSALAGKADAVDPSLSGTITVANGTTIRGAFASASDGLYFRSNSGNDTYTRTIANGSSATSIGGYFAYGSNDVNNSVQVLLRARGNNTATAASGIIWQKVTGGVVGAPPEFQFVSHNGTGYVVNYAMTSDGSTTNGNHIITKSYADANYGSPVFIDTDNTTFDRRSITLQPDISGTGVDSEAKLSLTSGGFGQQQMAFDLSTFETSGGFVAGQIIAAFYDDTGTPVDPFGDFYIRTNGSLGTVVQLAYRIDGNVDLATNGKIYLGEANDLTSVDGQVIFNGHLPPKFDGVNIDYTDITDGNHLINRDYLTEHIGIQSTQGLTIGADTLEFNNLSFEPKLSGQDIYDSSIWLHSNHVSSTTRHMLAVACDTFAGGAQQAIIGLSTRNGTTSEDSTIPLIISNQGGGEIWVGEDGADIQMKNVSVDLQQPPIFPRFTLSTLPAARLGAVIIVTDANSGAGTVCFANGTNWIDIKTGTTVA